MSFWEILTDPAFNGMDLALVILALVIGWAGGRYDKKRNAAKDAAREEES